MLLTELKYQIFRNKGRSALMILTSLFLLGAMAFYLGGMQANRTALLELGDKIPVKVQVVTADGSRSSGLFVHESKYDQLISTGVRDVRATTTAAGALSEAAKLQSPFLGGDVTIVGLNSIRAMPLTHAKYTYADGMDETFLEGDEAYCVLEESFAQDSGFSIGDTITLPVYFYPQVSGEYIAMGEKTLTVAGTLSTRQPCGFSMLVPAGWLRAEAHAQEMKYFGYDSLSMVVNDPLHLNEFKDRLTEIGMEEPVAVSEDYYTGSAAVVEDEIYTKTANKFREILQVYQGFLIPFFLLIAGLSCLVIFLMLRGSRREIAIASSLGKTKVQIHLTYLVEVMLLFVVGCAAALPPILFFSQIGISGAMAAIGIFLCCSGIGAFFALVLLLRFDPMELLTKVD